MARGRPPIITDERLLEIAREVFLERGIRATTAEVAERAGVSEATVFHRYKTKDSLFRAAMCPDLDDIPPILLTLEERVGKGDLAEQLHDIGMNLIELGKQRLPIALMSWSNPDAMLDRMRGQDAAPVQLQKKLTAYFDMERRAGRLVSGDPEILMRIFLGSVHGYVVGALFEWHSMPASKFVRGLVQVMMGAHSGQLDARGATTPVRRKS